MLFRFCFPLPSFRARVSRQTESGLKVIEMVFSPAVPKETKTKCDSFTTPSFGGLASSWGFNRGNVDPPRIERRISIPSKLWDLVRESLSSCKVYGHSIKIRILMEISNKADGRTNGPDPLIDYRDATAHLNTSLKKVKSCMDCLFFKVQMLIPFSNKIDFFF